MEARLPLDQLSLVRSRSVFFTLEKPDVADRILKGCIYRTGDSLPVARG